MPITLTAFRWVPEFAQGYVRDLRVRWALEEAGLTHSVTLIDLADRATPEYRSWQPFGQVPAYRDDTVELFETGAIVLHLAARSPALAPPDRAGQARVATWVFAALNSIEPQVQNFVHLDVFHAGEAWAQARRPQAEAALVQRLADLSTALGDKPYLEQHFTAGDLMMASVLCEAVHDGVLARFPSLDAYHQRCEARPAFIRAMDAQMQTFRDNAPA